MEATDLTTLTHTVLWAGAALGVAFGFIAEKTHFCTMGAVADLFTIESSKRLRMWFLAIAVATAGLQTMAYTGMVDTSKTIYTAPSLMWASHLLGGLLFGIGMVLSSGCGSKTLIRIGNGNLKSVVVFLIAGISAYATLKGLFGVVRVNTVDTLRVVLDTPQDILSVLGPHLPAVSPAMRFALLGLGLPAAIGLWALSRREHWSADFWLGGIAIGLIVLAAWWVTLHLGFVAEDPNTLEERFVGTYAGRPEAFSFVAPLAYSLEWLMFFSDKSRTLTLGIVSSAGVVLGSFIASKLSGTLRWESFKTADDMGHHFLGATLMGIGGVTALGCSVGQGLSGVATLSIGSWITFAAVLLGGVVGVKYQLWRLERMA